MAALRPLAHPPIREAIVEVMCEPVELQRVDALRDLLAGAFPTVNPFRLASLALQLPEERRGGGTDAAGGRATVRRCESADGTELALIGDPFHFERFLSTVSRPPAGLAPEIADFLTQMTLPGGAEGLPVSITQATHAASRTATELAVTVDIDASWDRTVPVDDRLPERLSQVLGSLRDLKNRVFFGLVTDELVSAYS